MNSIRKIIISSFLFLGIIACNKPQKVQNSNISDTIVSTNDSTTHLYSQTKNIPRKSAKIISFGPWPKVDTLIASYNIQYQVQDNNERFLIGKCIENSDTLCYYSGCDVTLNIKLPNNLLFSKKINRDLFQNYIPKEEFPKYTVNYLRINHVDDSGIFFDLSLCILDTDAGYDFELHVAPTGKFSIKEINYEEEDF